MAQNYEKIIKGNLQIYKLNYKNMKLLHSKNKQAQTYLHMHTPKQSYKTGDNLRRKKSVNSLSQRTHLPNV